MLDKLDAKLNQTKGNIKEAYGKLADNKRIHAEGLVDQAIGKAKEVAADVKDTVDGIVDELKN